MQLNELVYRIRTWNSGQLTSKECTLAAKILLDEMQLKDLNKESRRRIGRQLGNLNNLLP